MKIGWIGFGNKGNQLVNNLIHYGHEVYGYNRTFSKMSIAIENGLIPLESVEDLVKKCDVIFTMLNGSESVYQLYYENKGILEALNKFPKKLTCIDLTVCSANLAKYIANNKLGMEFLDAPIVYDNDEGDVAINYFCVGGKKEIFEKYKKLFNSLNGVVYYAGHSGNGQLGRQVRDLSVVGSYLSTVESIEYAKFKNLDLSKLESTITNGAASSDFSKKYFSLILNNEFDCFYHNEEWFKQLEFVLRENSACDFVLTKILFGIFKKINSEKALKNISDFYGGKTNEN